MQLRHVWLLRMESNHELFITGLELAKMKYGDFKEDLRNAPRPCAVPSNYQRLSSERGQFQGTNTFVICLFVLRQRHCTG